MGSGVQRDSKFITRLLNEIICPLKAGVVRFAVGELVASDLLVESMPDSCAS